MSFSLFDSLNAFRRGRRKKKKARETGLAPEEMIRVLLGRQMEIVKNYCYSNCFRKFRGWWVGTERDKPEWPPTTSAIFRRRALGNARPAGEARGISF